MPPSGARLPFSPTTPPVGASGLEQSRMTFCAGLNFTSRRFSATVLPVTVMQSPCRWPPSSSARISIGTPPASHMSLATNAPPGFSEAR